MANLGNAWHIPGSPEPQKAPGSPARAGTSDPVGALVPGTAITIFSGNQFQGAGGNPGNQFQDGSTLFFKRTTDANWTGIPMLFDRQLGNNKYYAATIPANTFQTGDVAQYYLRIAYGDHATTFLHANGDVSAATADGGAARTAPFTFPVVSSADVGEWGPVLQFPNVAIHTHVLPNGHVLMWGRRDRVTDTLDEHVCPP
jgi:hypothetical protein